MQILVTIVVIGFLAIGGIGWLISVVQESIASTRQENKKRQELKEKWKGRVVDKSKPLSERNGDIVSRHLGKLKLDRYRYYQVDNSVRDCIQDIAEAEGNIAMAPDHSYLSVWKRKATPEYLELSKTLEKLFKEKFEKLEHERSSQQIQQLEQTTSNLKEKYSDYIAQFYEVAERKVSILDEYGEENWGAVQKELSNLIIRIAKKEGHTDDEIKRWKKYSYSQPDEYQKLSDFLISSFRNFHKKEQSKPKSSVDFSAMKGVDFEGHLMGLLKENGFTDVRGTPVTGDQGADLIAVRDGKKIIIQAKRYEGSVGNKAVQEVACAVSYYGGDEGWVVTNSTFTKGAKELAQKTGVRLIDGRDLSRFSEIIA